MNMNKSFCFDETQIFSLLSSNRCTYIMRFNEHFIFKIILFSALLITWSIWFLFCFWQEHLIFFLIINAGYFRMTDHEKLLPFRWVQKKVKLRRIQNHLHITLQLNPTPVENWALTFPSEFIYQFYTILHDFTKKHRPFTISFLLLFHPIAKRYLNHMHIQCQRFIYSFWREISNIWHIHMILISQFGKSSKFCEPSKSSFYYFNPILFTYIQHTHYFCWKIKSGKWNVIWRFHSKI